MTREATDPGLRSLVAAIQGAVREPLGRSYHLHQLDGARLEAMVYLDPAGARIEWAHGRGDCAITGEGAAILAVLRGRRSADRCEADGSLVLYGDRDLIRTASNVFALRRRESPGAEVFALRLNPISAPRIVAMAEAGATAADIARAYGVSVRTIARWKRRLGFEWRPRGNPGKEVLADLWTSLRNLREIGADLGVTSRTVSRWARELGLSRRGSG